VIAQDWRRIGGGLAKGTSRNNVTSLNTPRTWRVSRSDRSDRGYRARCSVYASPKELDEMPGGRVKCLEHNDFCVLFSPKNPDVFCSHQLNTLKTLFAGRRVAFDGRTGKRGKPEAIAVGVYVMSSNNRSISSSKCQFARPFFGKRTPPRT
jgi:hypothetical protein